MSNRTLVNELDKLVEDSNIYNKGQAKTQKELNEENEVLRNCIESELEDVTVEGTEITVDDAAKYSRNKLELFGNTEQTQYTGKNLFNVANSHFGWGGYNFNLVDNIITIRVGDGNGGLAAGYQGQYTDFNFDTNKEYYFSVYRKTGYLLYKEASTTKWSRVMLYIKYEDGSTSNLFLTITSTTEQESKKINFTEGKTPVAYAIGRYLPGNTLENNQSQDFYIQLEEGTEATDYEPYVGGPSPNPKYPQDIHVVSGENTIEVQGKNLFDKNVERKSAFSTGDIGQVVGYGNSSASYSYVNCAKVEANKTYTLSWKIDGTKGATSNRNSKIVDSNNIVLEEFATWINNTTNITFTPQNTGYLVLTTDISSLDIQLEQGSTATSYVPYYHADYPINLGNIELCKIENYQDEIFKNEPNNQHYDSSLVDGGWYKYVEIGKIVADGTENWIKSTNYDRSYYAKNLVPNSNAFNTKMKCNLTKNFLTAAFQLNNYDYACMLDGWPERNLNFKNVDISTLEQMLKYLQQNNLILYYVVTTPTTTQITDETLISQLDEIYEQLKLVKGTNNITVTAEDLAPYIELTYKRSNAIKFQKEIDELKAMVLENS